MESEQNDQFISIIDQIEDLIDLYYQKKIKSKKLRTELTYYAKSTGFINNKCRQQTWKFLVNETLNNYSSGSSHSLENKFNERCLYFII